jgi:hypothetical protein
MQLQQMTTGARVRTIREIDLFPVGRFEPGQMGTVEVIDGDGETAPYCLVKLDQSFPGLEHWENRLQVWQDHMVICTAEDFEMIVVED